MTLFGKILIGLILALSLVFASLSAAVFSAQTNYRAKSDTLAQQLADSQSALQNREAQLQAEVADARAESRRLQDALDLKTGEAQDLRTEVRLTEEAANATRTGLDVQTALAGLSKEEADARREEALAQRERNATLSTDLTATRSRISELEDQLFGLRVSVEQMNEKQNQLLDENGDLKSYLRSKNEDIASILGGTYGTPAAGRLRQGPGRAAEHSREPDGRGGLHRDRRRHPHRRHAAGVRPQRRREVPRDR